MATFNVNDIEQVEKEMTKLAKQHQRATSKHDKHRINKQLDRLLTKWEKLKLSESKE